MFHPLSDSESTYSRDEADCLFLHLLLSFSVDDTSFQLRLSCNKCKIHFLYSRVGKPLHIREYLFKKYLETMHCLASHPI